MAGTSSFRALVRAGPNGKILRAQVVCSRALSTSQVEVRGQVFDYRELRRWDQVDMQGQVDDYRALRRWGQEEMFLRA